MEVNTQAIPVPTDQNYFDLRNCLNTTLDIKKVVDVAFVKDAFNQCTSELIWFKENEDLSIAVYDPDEVAIAHADVTSNLALKQTVAGAGSIEWAKTIEIKANYNSSFIQYIKEINSSEFTSGKKGDGVLALANGGFWVRETIIVNEGQPNEFREETVFPNVKLMNWIAPFSGNITSETNYTLEMSIQDWPATYAFGNYPSGWATPNGKEAVLIESTGVALTDTDLTFTALKITDTDNLHDVTITEPVSISVYDVDNNLLVTETFAGDNTNAVLTFDFTLHDTVRYAISYYMANDFLISYSVNEISKV